MVHNISLASGRGGKRAAGEARPTNQENKPHVHEARLEGLDVHACFLQLGSRRSRAGHRQRPLFGLAGSHHVIDHHAVRDPEDVL